MNEIEMNKDLERQHKANIWVPSIADILFLSVFLYLSFSAGRGLLADCDTGYHIRTGEYILKTGSIPKYDIFSFITPAIPWTAHEWLSEVIMALVHRSFGLTGVVIFFSFVISLTYYVLFRVARTYKGNILAAAMVVVFVIAASQIHWLARPHIFSLLLTVIWYSLLDSYQYNDRNYLNFLPAIMLLWVNLHGGFIIAFVLIGIYLAGNLARFLTSNDLKDKTECRRKVRLLGLISGACLLISLINPQGYHILLFPFKLTSSKFIMDNVSEFVSPNFHEPMAFTYLLFIMIAILALSGKRLNIIELALTMIFTYMALYSARYIPLFGIILAPILIRQADHLLDGFHGRLGDFFRRRAERTISIDTMSKGYLWPLVAMAAVFFCAATGRVEYSFDAEIKPVAAVEFLKKEHIEGNVFNNDEFGDYIIYASWPEYRVFFDGRSDMYGVERMKEYFAVSRMEPGWEDILKKYEIKWIIYNADSIFSRFLFATDSWKLIYSDKVANIFMRDIPEDRELIEKSIQK
ncbi:MAG TPA: hypothetical protein VN328_05725 [Thermodesulfovibrionales bacterium]|nr:hypothetical protein [Thermodesulfovibrionales bacterium]